MDERMKVLELLEKGLISADEATELLSTLNRGNRRPFIDKDTKEHMEEKFHRFTNNVDHYAKEFGTKAQAIYKEMEPKIKKASHTVLEKTAAVFDDISRSLNESLENARKKAEEACEAAEASKSCCDASDDAPKPN